MFQPELKVRVNYEKCCPERCEQGVCAAVLKCPIELLKQEEPYEMPYLIQGFCQECGKCVDACPLKAIEML